MSSSNRKLRNASEGHVSAGAADRVLAFLSPNNRLARQYARSPDGSALAYIADAETDNVFELYVVPANGSGLSVKVSQPLMPRTDVLDFAWSPDGQRIACTADQVADTVEDLYVVSASGTGLQHLAIAEARGENDRFAAQAPEGLAAHRQRAAR